MKDSRRILKAGLIGLGVGFGLAILLGPKLRDKLKEISSSQLQEFAHSFGKAWVEYPKRLAYAFSTGREAAKAKERELKKIFSMTKKAKEEALQESQEAPKYII